MKRQKLLSALAFSLIFSGAYANEVLITSDQAINVTYRILLAKQNGKPVVSHEKNIQLQHDTNISIPLKGFDEAAIVITKINGHELPAHINRIDKGKQCSLVTNKSHATAALKITATEHSVSCASYGGVFG